jgi:hypothetical protein
LLSPLVHSSLNPTNYSLFFMAVVDAGALWTQKFRLPTPGSTTLDVVYTNDTSIVESTLLKYEQWLQWDTHQFIGLDLEYTKDNKNHVNILVIRFAFNATTTSRESRQVNP